MVVDAFVLPLPGKSLGVIFWDRPRRAGAQARTPSSLAVYAPGELSAGELVELRAALVASAGDGLAERPPVSRPLLVVWWVLGAMTALGLAFETMPLSLGFAFLAFLAVGATLPWGTPRRAFTASRRRTIARGLLRQLAALSPAPGADPRAAERLSALWQFARRQRGSVSGQLRALEQYCLELSWPAAARVYADRRPLDAEGSNGVVVRLVRRRAARGAPLYAATELRAWA